jgi:hypothetical protein
MSSINSPTIYQDTLGNQTTIGDLGLLVSNSTTGLFIADEKINVMDTTTQPPTIVASINPLNLIAVAPHFGTTTLSINQTIFLENDDTAPTRTIGISSGDPATIGEYFGLNYNSTTNDDFVISSTSSGSIKYIQEGIGATTKQLVIDPTEIVLQDTASLEKVEMTNNLLQYTSAGGGVSSASWSSIIAGGGGVPSIDQVLAVGQDANNQPITNLNSIQIASGTTLSNNSLAFNNGANAGVITDLFSINGQQYYPYAQQDLNSILAAGNSANSQSITGLINVDLQTINSSSYPPATPALASVLAVGNGASNQDITGVNNLNVYSINGTYYPPYPISPYGLTQTLSYSNDGNGLSLTNVSGIGNVSGSFTISSKNSGAIDINSSYDTNMNNTGTFTINNGNGININSANAIQRISSSGSISTQSNQNTSIYSQQNITLEVVSGYIYIYGLPTSSGGPANSLYNAGGILMIN